MGKMGKEKYHIRQAEPHEAGVLTDLVMRSKAHWGYPKEWIESWKDQLTITPEFIQDSVAFVAELNGEIKGCWCRAKIQTDEVTPGFLFIAPDAIGTGCAAQLWQAIKAGLLEVGVTSFVLEADPNAVPFYEKLGAIKIGEHDSESIPGRKIPVMRIELSNPSQG
jgi:hypothetical protein